MLVLDGNMKNSREVCFAVDAGYTEFSNLPGKIKAGCPNTPAYKSRYCSIHAPFDVQSHEAEASGSNSHEEPGIITSKRTTRNCSVSGTFI